ncbi:MAG TPA: alpha/beta fold hydrolase [Desulfobacterales bacterium]|nr:alpha/beta fold hydrolase [Desulfobacterales bacterium]
MPLISNSDYKPLFIISNAHFQTICPTLFRKVKGVNYVRERIFTPDCDFIDLDWSTVGAERAVIVSHGLEGHSRRSYVLGMIKAFNTRGWDGIAFNFRGCSGEPNRLLRSYHCGATDDLHTVVSHVIKKKSYSCISLVGFSVGGNLTLMYLGEKKYPLFDLIKSAAAVSVPCDLESSSRKLAKRSNMIYMKRFLKMFHNKIRIKMRMMPGEINDAGYHSIKTFEAFDNRYTAPIHGFLSAKDYWSKCSCKQYLENINIPSLLIIALNDPFLGKDCYPVDEAKKNPYIFLEMPKSGGHVGFVDFKSHGEYWHETRIASFADNNL